ncbi:hypothetical protein NUU61_000977 [Penicillium alfredii]|uniref:Uncharacterized protein n=1 Tax=Penicillium alfredii TaxID=1506179 RepID=A0A9W9GB44_9EURO|nr:uncharacterized protein NUU61_000977 [Penicillium alfredii]KAJ5115218.1 hypothetical protein NUU61_000977 [Penicillium alfredii]
MSGLLHKAEDALHGHHHDPNKSADHTSHHATQRNENESHGNHAQKHHHHDAIGHHPGHHHSHSTDTTNNDFQADRKYDHALKGGSAGVGFEE